METLTVCMDFYGNNELDFYQMFVRDMCRGPS